MNRLQRFFAAPKEFLAKHWRKLALAFGGLLVLCAAFVAFSYVTVAGNDKYILGADAINTAFSEPPVGIVFGGGIENGKPRPHLQDRLDAAAQLYREGRVRKLLVSGDNRFVEYNEPQVMHNYLTEEKGVPEAAIQLDNAGRSTYETCERASKIFGLDQALLITQGTHLPRAIYLCRHFGVESYGYNSSGQASAGWQVGQRWREVMARTKAVLNVCLHGEQTVLGDKIDL